ncbi:hypothetical protein K461DRAFT_263930 [Myriangium duriaei CBS 260.36]|uniref:Uncharacterized protein n=1 Tax=Myriangium duriaei CBS 260.36 TaxID=1168546 RepID=A0A9P4MRW8_9PEZI|nr:hypothetical protein K461DRAFT_263930 [Myriangium duriaei CBS 260.36]
MADAVYDAVQPILDETLREAADAMDVDAKQGATAAADEPKIRQAIVEGCVKALADAAMSANPPRGDVSVKVLRSLTTVHDAVARHGGGTTLTRALLATIRDAGGELRPVLEAAGFEGKEGEEVDRHFVVALMGFVPTPGRCEMQCGVSDPEFNDNCKWLL